MLPVLLSLALAVASSQLSDLIYQGKPVQGYLGGTADFPREFTEAPACEGGVSQPDDRNGCVWLKPDGTGTWENDVGLGVRQSATPIQWYLIADKAGTVTKAVGDGVETYFVLIKFTQPYYGQNPGDTYAFPVRKFVDERRIVIDSKWRVY